MNIDGSTKEGGVAQSSCCSLKRWWCLRSLQRQFVMCGRQKLWTSIRSKQQECHQTRGLSLSMSPYQAPSPLWKLHHFNHGTQKCAPIAHLGLTSFKEYTPKLFFVWRCPITTTFCCCQCDWDWKIKAKNNKSGVSVGDTTSLSTVVENHKKVSFL